MFTIAVRRRGGNGHCLFGQLAASLLGGLNYQIEHHPFPSMPSVNLRQAKPIIRDFCARIGVPHTETSQLYSHRLALRHLHQAGGPLRRQPSPNA